MAETFKQAVAIDGVDEAKRKLKLLDKEGNRAMRAAARAIVDEETPRLQAAGRSSDKQSALVAGSIRSRSDRYPTIVAGGSKRLAVSDGRKGKNRPRAQDVFFGAEFGGRGEKKWKTLTREKTSLKTGKTKKVFAGIMFDGYREKMTTNQFRPWRKRQGYWFWPQLREDQARIGDKWLKAVDDVVKEATS